MGNVARFYFYRSRIVRCLYGFYTQQYKIWIISVKSFLRSFIRSFQGALLVSLQVSFYDNLGIGRKLESSVERISYKRTFHIFHT